MALLMLSSGSPLFAEKLYGTLMSLDKCHCDGYDF